MIKAIETHYDGHRFRSRLEARWAVFFNSMFWSWKYETEGFVLDNGESYLPDFYLPELKTWVEVKPDYVFDIDKEKCRLLSKTLSSPFCVVIVRGLPAPVQYDSFINGIETCGVTFSSYIRMKGWHSPYFGGDWEEKDYKCFEKARKARFEFEEREI